MKIQISSETRALLSDIGGFVIVERGSVLIKVRSTPVGAHIENFRL